MLEAAAAVGARFSPAAVAEGLDSESVDLIDGRLAALAERRGIIDTVASSSSSSFAKATEDVLRKATEGRLLLRTATEGRLLLRTEGRLSFARLRRASSSFATAPEGQRRSGAAGGARYRFRHPVAARLLLARTSDSLPRLADRLDAWVTFARRA